MAYQEKKAFFKKILTIYGRKAVEEALMDKQLSAYKLHLAESNKPAAIIKHCIELAKNKSVEIEYHDKRQLSFISKNAKQDQGIALDIHMDNFHQLEDIQTNKAKRLLLLDNVTNPQNVGMIIRSAAAGYLDGIIIPQNGCAELGPLVIKASAGSIFKAAIYRCEKTMDAIKQLPDFEFIGLALNQSSDFFELEFQRPSVFVLGNESTGMSKEIAKACDKNVKIPMNNGIESLNVAVTASLIAFHPAFRAS